MSKRVSDAEMMRRARTQMREHGKQPAWCLTHNEFAWLYDDDSVGCWYDRIVESSFNEHEVRPIGFAPTRRRRWETR